MKTYIALLRGINVTGKNILPMKELAAMFQDLGFEDVQTYIQSGNVVFRARENSGEPLEGHIRSKINERFGFSPQVLLLGVSQLRDAVRHNPFDTGVGKALHFYFLAAPPAHPDIEKLQALKTETEAFKLHQSVFYLYAPDGIGRSKLAEKVEKCLGVPATARNWNTVRKLLEMTGE